jgi:hypothetical protein
MIYTTKNTNPPASPCGLAWRAWDAQSENTFVYDYPYVSFVPFVVLCA